MRIGLLPHLCSTRRLWALLGASIVAPSLAAADGAWQPSKVDKPTQQAHEKACAGGKTADCISLGDMHWRAYFSANGGDRKEAQLALAFYEKACALGDVVGCRDVGSALTEGIGTRDLERARRLFQQACDAGDGGGCALLGAMLEDIGTPPAEPSPMTDAARESWRAEWRRFSQKQADSVRAAMPYYEKACSGKLEGLGCLSGCDKLAILYRGYGGIKADREKANHYEERACTAGCSNSCDYLGNLYRDGDGVQADPARAAEYYGKACQIGLEPSCASLSELYREGRGVAKDIAKAKRLLRMACLRSHNQVELCRRR